MTNKERLELIRTNWENDHINTCDIDWLIEQAVWKIYDEEENHDE